MSLRRFFIASSLILSPLGFGSAAFAGTTSIFELNVTVPVTANITSTPTTEAANLYDSISNSRQGIVKIADLNVIANVSEVGLTVSSTNSGNLENYNEDKIGYKLQMTSNGDAAPTDPTDGFVTVNDFSGTVSGDADLYIQISITNMLNAPAGTYSDTLTLTIATIN